jgi:hypothetical protein
MTHQVYIFLAFFNSLGFVEIKAIEEGWTILLPFFIALEIDLSCLQAIYLLLHLSSPTKSLDMWCHMWNTTSSFEKDQITKHYIFKNLFYFAIN